METKVITPKRFLVKEGKTSLNKIHEYSSPVVDAIFKEAESRGIRAEGPLEFIYLGATNDMEKEFTLQIVLPVSEEKEISNQYSYKASDPFKCVTHIHQGDITKMYPVYEKLYQQIFSEGLKPNSEIREVYLSWDHLTSNNNLTEIQIGID